MPRGRQTKKRAPRGRTRQRHEEQNSASSIIDVLKQVLSSTKGGSVGPELASFAAQVLPGLGERLKGALSDPKLKRDLAAGSISVLVDLYGAAREHRKRILEAEEKIQSILMDALRNLPLDTKAKR